MIYPISCVNLSMKHTLLDFMQAKRLENKDREEEAAQIALKEQAKKELEDWYKGHSEQVRVASEF